MKKNKILYIFVLFITIACHNSDYYLQKAIELNDNAQYEQAVEMLNKSIKLDSNNPDTYIERAYSYSELNNNDAAISDYTQAIILDSTYTKAWFGRGDIKAYMKNYRSALIDLDKAISLKTMKNIEGEGNVIMEIKGFDNKDIPYVNILYKRAIIYFNIDSLNSAFKDYSYCIKSNYRLSESYYWRGVIYFAYNKKSEARSDFINSIKYADENSQYEVSEAKKNLKEYFNEDY